MGSNIRFSNTVARFYVEIHQDFTNSSYFHFKKYEQNIERTDNESFVDVLNIEIDDCDKDGDQKSLICTFFVGDVHLALLLTLVGDEESGCVLTATLNNYIDGQLEESISFEVEDSNSDSFECYQLAKNGNKLFYNARLTIDHVVFGDSNVEVSITPGTQVYNNWYYQADKSERWDYLNNFRTETDLLASILAAFPARGLLEQRDGQTNIYRPVFELELSPENYDYFFNSRFGMRGAYYDSVEKGELWTKSLFNGVKFLLTVLSPPKGHLVYGMSNKEVLASLQGTQAKIWVKEFEALVQTSSAGNLDLKIGRWRDQANANIKAFEENGNIMPTNMPGGWKPVWGVRSTKGETLLEIKGGWINTDTEEEWIDKSKLHRSSDIHLYGFS